MAECVLLVHAVALHLTVAVLVRLRPFGEVVRRLSLWYVPRCGRRAPEVTVLWAVRTGRFLVPMGSTCLTEGLTAHLLLARHGCPSDLLFGVARPDGTALTAHAWVEREGRIVIGDTTTAAYAPLRRTRNSL